MTLNSLYNYFVHINDNRGFTLIELLVTIAIVAILVSLSIQNYNELKKAGYDAEIRTIVHNIRSGAELAITDRINKNEYLYSMPSYTNKVGGGMPISHLGLTLPSYIYANVYFANNSGSGTLSVDSIYVLNCKAKRDVYISMTGTSGSTKIRQLGANPPLLCD